MQKVIERKRYDTEKALLIASDYFWDGHNWERNCRNEYLYKTKKGNFFLYKTTIWEGEVNNIVALGKTEAMDAYEQLLVKKVEWETAFDEETEEA